MRCLPVVLLVLSFDIANSARQKSGLVKLRVMSFNTWNTGANVNDGMIKIAKHIKAVDPDFVSFQEIESGEQFRVIQALLGTGKWQGVYRTDPPYPDTGFVTKHNIINSTVTQTSAAIGAVVTLRTLPPVNLTFWAIHLDAGNYGPYAACNKMTTDLFQIEAGEYDLTEGKPGRVQEMEELNQNAVFQQHLAQSEDTPMFAVGDFNAPSHLDWTEEASDLHCDWAFEWPTSKVMNEQFGMIDSYRKLLPNPITDPGNTWSTVQKQTQGWGWLIPEPQDRIDFIYYKGTKLRPQSVKTYQGDQVVQPKPFTGKNDWPTDHFAVVGDFDFYI